MSDNTDYDSIKLVLDLFLKNLPKDKDQEKILLATSVAGIVGVVLIKVVRYIREQNESSKLKEE